MKYPQRHHSLLRGILNLLWPFWPITLFPTTIGMEADLQHAIRLVGQAGIGEGVLAGLNCVMVRLLGSGRAVWRG